MLSKTLPKRLLIAFGRYFSEHFRFDFMPFRMGTMVDIMFGSSLTVLSHNGNHIRYTFQQ